MKTLRPHQVFDKLYPADRLALLSLPDRFSLTSMLERAVLASLLKLVQPRSVFEFGTYLGETTVILAANTKGRVYTMDLGEEVLARVREKLDEFELSNVSRGLAQEPLFRGTVYEDRIETIIGDSTACDFSRFYGLIDFVLIDGGHHIDVVASDTRQAFKMLSANHSGCIVWHDFGNPEYQISDFLVDLSQRIELLHVAETSYVFFVKDAGTGSSLGWGQV